MFNLNGSPTGQKGKRLSHLAPVGLTSNINKADDNILSQLLPWDCAKRFPSVISFNSHNHMRYMLLLLPVYKWMNWGMVNQDLTQSRVARELGSTAAPRQSEYRVCALQYYAKYIIIEIKRKTYWETLFSIYVTWNYHP